MFGKSAAHLTRNEAALMVAALQVPAATAAGSATRDLNDRAAWVGRKIAQRQGDFSCLP